ncbi:unnamed protein product, partial [Mesorhabditis spiculigera]
MWLGIGPICLLLLLQSNVEARKAKKKVSEKCKDAPDKSRQAICERMQAWTRQAKKTEHIRPKAKNVPAKRLLDGTVATEKDLGDCLSMRCVCEALTGISSSNCTYRSYQLQKSVRKEYRMMTDLDRARYQQALRKLKDNGMYDNYIMYHLVANDDGIGGAHNGPAFLPWHRETLKRLELSLRKIDPQVSLPYWDSTLDAPLPDLTSSVMFLDELAGPAQGLVNSGPFKGYADEPNATDGATRAHILRNTAGEFKAVYREDRVQLILSFPNVSQMLARSNSVGPNCPPNQYNCLEYEHGIVHNTVDEDMYDTNTSPRDPLFYMHHAFTDLIWEMWRQKWQTRDERATQWPPRPECSTAQHQLNWPMAPYSNLLNIDGISNDYMDYMITYAPRPTCNATTACGSRFLFCDLTKPAAPRCVSKIKLGGQCDTFTASDVCYGGVCVAGKCATGAT